MDIVVIGGTGFIGRHLVDFLVASDRVGRVRLLSRAGGKAESEKVEIIRGDVFDKASLRGLIIEGAVVVNLAYLAGVDPSKNLELIRNVVEVCQEKHVRKLIHVSTAVVAGRAEGSRVTEESVVCPFSEYDKTKMLVEQEVANSTASFQSIILRPTAVFGPEGKNLIQLANNLFLGNFFKNYLKSCLYGDRTMNLVSVENVVSALGFLIFIDRDVGKQAYIVADDDAPGNNYSGVERMLMCSLGVSNYPIPRVVLPRVLLRCMLTLLGKSNVDAGRHYSSEKLEALGWVKTRDFELRVKRFAEWYQNRYGA